MIWLLDWLSNRFLDQSHLTFPFHSHGSAYAGYRWRTYTYKSQEEFTRCAPFWYVDITRWIHAHIFCSVLKEFLLVELIQRAFFSHLNWVRQHCRKSLKINTLSINCFCSHPIYYSNMKLQNFNLINWGINDIYLWLNFKFVMFGKGNQLNYHKNSNLF